MTEPTASTASVTVVRSSSLPDFPDCPRRWAARQLKDELLAHNYLVRSIPTGVAAIIGTAVHKGAAVTMEEKVRHGAIAPVSVAVDAAIDELRSELRLGVAYDDDTTREDDAVQQARRMTMAFHSDIAPKLNPILVEARLEAVARRDLMISGQADQIAQEPDSIDDLKTGKFRGNYKPQYGSYALLRRTYATPPERIREIFIPRHTLRRPQDPPQIHEHSVAECESAADNIITHIHDSLETFRRGRGRIAPGDPWAFVANPNSKLCSPRFCPAWGTRWCTEHRKETRE
jgi:hypothetical protein